MSAPFFITLLRPLHGGRAFFPLSIEAWAS